MRRRRSGEEIRQVRSHDRFGTGVPLANPPGLALSVVDRLPEPKLHPQRLGEDDAASLTSLRWSPPSTCTVLVARDPRHTLNVVHELTELGIDVLSATEPFDASTPAGRFMLTMLAGAAGLERENILDRSRDATLRLAREGVWLGGIVPYGYCVEGEDKAARLVPSDKPVVGLDMSEADVVRMIYRLVADDGWSTFRVADYLTSLGVPPAYVRDNRHILKQGRTESADNGEHPVTVKGKRKEATAGIWRPARIRNLIVNSTYKGEHLYGKRSKKLLEPIIRTVPPHVDANLWQRAQETLHANMLFSRRNAKREYLLRGLIKCGLCGLTYVGTAYPTIREGVKVYYVCNGKQGYRGIYGLRGERCPAKSVRAEKVESAIWRDIEGFLRNPGDILDELVLKRHAHIQQNDDTLIQITKTEEEIAGKQEERDRILALYRRKQIGEHEVDHQLQLIHDEESQLKRTIVSLRRQLASTERDAREAEEAESLLRALAARLDDGICEKTKRELIETLVGSIFVNTSQEGGKKHAEVVVTYRFPARITVCTDTDSSRPRASASRETPPSPERD